MDPNGPNGPNSPMVQYEQARMRDTGERSSRPRNHDFAFSLSAILNIRDAQKASAVVVTCIRLFSSTVSGVFCL